MAEQSAHDPASEAVVRDAARAGDLDRYLSALLSPRDVRQDLITLTAFLGEIARIPEVVSEPMMGEVRLQWWRDVLEGERTEESSGSPIADALLDTIARHSLPLDAFHAILEARSTELVPRITESEEDLEAYLDCTDGSAFALAARILGAGEDPAVAELCQAAGRSYGRIRLLRAFPASLAKGRNPLPLGGNSDWTAAVAPHLAEARDSLEEARRRLLAAPQVVLPGVLPLALVEPYLAALQRLGPDVAREKADISPLTRVWRLWWASVRGRI